MFAWGPATRIYPAAGAADLRRQEGGVVVAATAPRIIDKGLVSDRVVVDTVVNKDCDHLPLYRQSLMLERKTGLEIHRARMDGWVMRVGERLKPVAEAVRREC